MLHLRQIIDSRVLLKIIVNPSLKDIAELDMHKTVVLILSLVNLIVIQIVVPSHQRQQGSINGNGPWTPKPVYFGVNKRGQLQSHFKQSAFASLPKQRIQKTHRRKRPRPSYLKLQKTATIVDIDTFKRNVNRSIDNADCNGYDNFLEDLEYFSYFLDVGLAIGGTICIAIEILTQAYANFATFKIDFPQLILPLIFGGSDNIPDGLNNFYTFFGNFDAVFNFIFMNPLANVLKTFAIVLQFLSTVNLGLNTFGLFPQTTRQIARDGFGIDIDKVFEGYGCEETKRQQMNNIYSDIVNQQGQQQQRQVYFYSKNMER